MKKRFIVPAYVIALLWMLQILVSPTVQAATDISDGTYSIEYLITKAENESVSMANDYFEKPAVLKVKGGEITAQIQINHSKWITIFKTAMGNDYANVEVIQSDKEEDTRMAQFKVEDLSKPLLSKIHVTVPDIDYDHDYTIRFMFDPKSLKQTEATKTATNKSETVSKAGSSQTNSNQLAQTAPTKSTDALITKQPAAVANPQTGDKTPITMWVGVLVLSGLFVIYQLKARGRMDH